MALKIISEIFENNQQPLFREEGETRRCSSSTHGSQLGMMSPAKFDYTKEDILSTEPTLEDIPFSSDQRLHLGFNSPPKPWLPPKLLQKFDRMKRTQLKKEKMVELIKETAEISIDFYQVKPGTFIAIELDGCIVESADTKIDLLLRIQGKKFDTPIFVWEAGSESFSGWGT